MEKKARLLSNVSHYAVILTDGLSTDRDQAIQTAQFLKATNSRFKLFVVGMGDSIGHEELVQLPTDPSFTFAPDNDDLLLTTLKDSADYGCTGKKHYNYRCVRFALLMCTILSVKIHVHHSTCV
jgi:hypothetical protein